MLGVLHKPGRKNSVFLAKHIRKPIFSSIHNLRIHLLRHALQELMFWYILLQLRFNYRRAALCSGRLQLTPATGKEQF